ncbi:hypothetical protein [Natrarchaeobius oligotrophus]|uniref:Caspase family protein n=1 Tax=Natrarchaeobius chitinivorans TaxID=1679083 RepID=A0A3N6NI81_NATCH|nr:hypothetical protein [Natrarchaeobius chitinivorans]RQG98852.1 hypothetical protein EA472_16695 [Natrarchaeobius chitinivorans]
MTVPTFEPDDEPGVTIVDSIANRRFPLRTASAIDPHEVDTDWCPFPIDSAIAFETTSVVLPYVVPTCVRDPDGETLADAEHFAFETFPDGEYLLEFTAPIRFYLRVRTELTVASADDRLAVEFGDETRVRLGAVSTHDRPAGTVTTTDEPADLARAVSTFGSALKTTTAERSLPSYRGHPPLIDLGDRVDVPAELESPDTGVTIVAPEDRLAVYATASPAYYLGATVVTGDRPRLETDAGFEYPLGSSPAAFVAEVGRVLKHVFVVDTVSRTEGVYDVGLRERELFEATVDVDLPSLYDAALSEQLPTILSIPFETLEPVAPTWQLTTFVTPGPANATALPFLASDLSLVRIAPTRASRTRAVPDPPAEVNALTRSRSRTDEADAGGAGREGRTVDGRANGADGLRDGAGTDDRGADRRAVSDAYVSLPDTETFETAWLGTGVPLGANKLHPGAFVNDLERSPAGDAIEITVVCNDSRMVAEYEASEEGLYGNRDELPFDVTVRRTLSVEELRDAIAAETDFLHYIGHVDDDAFVCRDGTLPANELSPVGVDTFLINGCRSYEPGLRLLEAGSSAGIVTLSEVDNRDATAVGRLLAQLLNCGFTFRSAMEIAREHRIVGNQYVVVGDGSVAIAQSGGGVPNQCRVEPTDDGRYVLRQQTYHSQHGVGALCIPYLDEIDRYCLAGTELPPVTLSGSELERFFQLEAIPVVFDGTFGWSTDERLTGP